MAIQVTAPERIGFSLNPIVWKFESDLEGVTLGSISQNIIVFTGAVPDGTLISIRWNGNQQQLRAVASPRDFGGEIPAGDGGTAYVNSLVSWFQNNYYFNQDFNVAVTTHEGNPTLLFQAKDNGSAYDFSPTSFAGGYTAVDVGGVNTTQPANPSVQVELWARRGVSLEYLRIYQSTLPLDVANAALLDVSRLLHGQLEADHPSMVAPGGTFVHYSRIDYYLKYAPAGGENFSVGQLSQTDDHTALLGGTSYEAGSDATVENTLLGLTQASDRFLSLHGSTRYVYPDQPVFLSFINLRATSRAEANMLISVTYDDASTAEILLTGILTLHQYQKALWPVGHNQLNLAQPTKLVASYTARLVDDADAPISEQITFVVRFDNKPYRRYFVYANSLGGTDTLYTYGKGSVDLKYFREEAEQVLPYTYAREDGQYMEWDHELQESFDVASGWIKLGDYLHFRDLFRSPRKFRIVGGETYPINIQTSSIREGKDGTNTQAISFSYQYAFRNRVVSLADLEKEHLGGGSTPPPGVMTAGSINLVPPGVPFSGIVDEYPTVSSTNPVTSGGVYEALSQKQDKLAVGSSDQYMRGDGTLGNFQQAVQANQARIGASESEQGEVKLASLAEMLTGTNTNKSATPAGVKAAIAATLGLEPTFDPIPAQIFTPGIQATKTVNLATYLTSGHNPANLTMKVLSKNTFVQKTVVNGVSIDITANSATQTDGSVVVEIKDNKGFSRTETIPVQIGGGITAALKLVNSTTQADVATIPVDNSGSYDLPDKWNVKLDVTGSHDGIYLFIRGGGASGDALNYKNTTGDYLPVPAANSGSYRIFPQGIGTASPAGSYTVQAKVFRNGLEIYTRTTTFVLNEAGAVVGSTTFEFWDEGTTPAKIANIPTNNSGSYLRPAAWDVRMNVVATTHDAVHARIVDANGQTLFQYQLPYVSVTQTTDAVYQLFGVSASQSSYPNGTYYVYFTVFLAGATVLEDSVGFTLYEQPTCTVDLLSANAQGEAFKLLTLPDSGSQTPLPPKWDVRYTVGAISHDQFLLTLEKYVSGAYQQATQQGNSYTGPVFATTYEMFSTQHSETVVSAYGLTEGIYRATLSLLESGVEVFSKVVTFELTASLAACQKAPEFYYGNGAPITEITSTNCRIGVDALGVEKIRVKTYLGNNLFDTVVVTMGPTGQNTNRPLVTFSKPHSPGVTYRMTIEGESCQSGISEATFTIPGTSGDPSLNCPVGKPIFNASNGPALTQVTANSLRAALDAPGIESIKWESITVAQSGTVVENYPITKNGNEYQSAAANETGAGYVLLTENAHYADYVFNVPRAGQHPTRVKYSANNNQQEVLRYSLNSGPIVEMNVSGSGTWNDQVWTDVFNLLLNAGNNTIRIYGGNFKSFYVRQVEVQANLTPPPTTEEIEGGILYDQGIVVIGTSGQNTQNPTIQFNNPHVAGAYYKLRIQGYSCKSTPVEAQFQIPTSSGQQPKLDLLFYTNEIIGNQLNFTDYHTILQGTSVELPAEGWDMQTDVDYFYHDRYRLKLEKKINGVYQVQYDTQEVALIAPAFTGGYELFGTSNSLLSEQTANQYREGNYRFTQTYYLNGQQVQSKATEFYIIPLGGTPPSSGDKVLFAMNTTGYGLKIGETYGINNDWVPRINKFATVGGSANKAISLMIEWHEWEPTPGVYSTTDLTNAMNYITGLGLKVSILFWPKRPKNDNQRNIFIPDADKVKFANGELLSDQNTNNNSGIVGSLASEDYLTKVETSLAALSNFLYTNYPTHIHNVRFGYSSAEEYCNERLYPQSGGVASLGDYSDHILSAWRFWLQSKYGSGSGAVPYGTGTAGTMLMFYPENANGGGYNLSYTNEYGRDWYRFMTGVLHKAYYRWAKSIKNTAGSQNRFKVIAYCPDFGTSQGSGSTLHTAQMLVTAAKLDGLYHTDGINIHDLQKKYLPMDVLEATFQGQGRSFEMEIDPIDLDPSGTGHDYGRGGLNYAALRNAMLAFFAKGGDTFHMAMAFSVGGENRGTYITVDEFDGFGPVYEEVRNLYATASKPNRTGRPTQTTNVASGIWGQSNFFYDKLNQMGSQTQIVNLIADFSEFATADADLKQPEP